MTSHDNIRKLADSINDMHAAMVSLYHALPYTSLVGGQDAQRQIARYLGAAYHQLQLVLDSYDFDGESEEAEMADRIYLSSLTERQRTAVLALENSVAALARHEETGLELEKQVGEARAAMLAALLDPTPVPKPVGRPISGDVQP